MIDITKIRTEPRLVDDLKVDDVVLVAGHERQPFWRVAAIEGAMIGTCRVTYSREGATIMRTHVRDATVNVVVEVPMVETPFGPAVEGEWPGPTPEQLEALGHPPLDGESPADAEQWVGESGQVYDYDPREAYDLDDPKRLGPGGRW